MPIIEITQILRNNFMLKKVKVEFKIYDSKFEIRLILSFLAYSLNNYSSIQRNDKTNQPIFKLTHFQITSFSNIC